MNTGVSTWACGKDIRQARALDVEHWAKIFRERACFPFAAIMSLRAINLLKMLRSRLQSTNLDSSYKLPLDYTESGCILNLEIEN